MKHQIEAVKIFHETYKLNYKETPTTNIGLEKIKLRFNLMAEENEEYFEAANNNDLIVPIVRYKNRIRYAGAGTGWQSFG